MRIVAGADLVTAQRVSTIRMLNIAVGVITGLVSLVGVHAWHSSHAPPTFAGFSPASGFGNPPPIPNPLATPWTGITSLPSPYPLPALSLPEPPLTTSIIVQPGDSLSTLACRYLTTVRALEKMNNLGQSTLIVAGQRLNVPVTFGITGSC